MSRLRFPALALAAALAVPLAAGAQDIRRIDDRSVTRDRHERAVIANLDIEGERFELTFQRETVPGAQFLRVMAKSVTTYRYLGFDGQALRFLYTSGDAVAELTYPPNAAGRFVFVPEALQHTRLLFELVPVPERGVIQAALMDNGLAR